MESRGRPRKNNGLCAKCGTNERVSWSKSYCKDCAQGFTLETTRDRLRKSLEQGDRVEVCLRCKELKSIYPPQPGYCIDCFRYYANQSEKSYRQRKWDWLRSLKEGKPCTDCDKVYPFYVMQWDHCKGEKLFNVGRSVRAGRANILAEINKCELVCANCHAERTYKRKQNSPIASS